MWLFSSNKANHPTRSPSRRSSRSLALEQLEDRCLMSAGVLDPSFGSGGIVTDAGMSSAQSVAVQSDGKVLALGSTSTGTGFKLVRTNTDGSLDTSFGSGGVVTTSFGKYADYGEALAVQSNGQIIAAGTVDVSVKGSVVAENGLVRYNSNGTLDTTFGNSGKVMTSGTGGIEGMALQSDGKIVTVGSSGNGALEVCRYNANGSLDSTFGSGGKVILNFFGQTSDGHSVAIQPDGKIVVSGITSQMVNGSLEWHTVVLRLNPNGTLDTTFGSGGEVFSDAFGTATSHDFPNPTVALQTVNGATDILLGGGKPTDYWVLERYTSNGSLDSTFGNGGIMQTNFGGQQMDYIHSLAVQGDGEIIAVGDSLYSDTNGLGVISVARYTANGTPDSTFGTGGLVRTLFDQQNGYGDDGNGVAIQSDGRIVVVGDTPNNNELILARYLASQPQIGSLTANPNPVTAGSSLTLTASSLTDSNPGVSITQVAFYLDSNNDGTLETGSDTLLGDATQTSPGVWTLTNSSAFGLTAGTYTLFAQAKDSDGVFGTPVALTLTVQ